MAKTRAQRKAERRRREAQQQAGGGDVAAERDQESRSQHDTQAPVSGDVAEVEAILETGANPDDYGEHARAAQGSTAEAPAEPKAQPAQPSESERPRPQAPAPSRADVGAPEQKPQKESRRDRKAREREEKLEAARRDAHKSGGTEKAEKRRGPVLGFFASCWAELKKVQWPDRDTLVQASAVTIIFVAVAATYLGALDAGFNWLIKQIL